MIQSSHRKIRKNGKTWVTRKDGTGKKNLVAPAYPERGHILLASDTVGVKASTLEFLSSLGGYNDGSWMLFTIDTTKNPDNINDASIIVPLQLGECAHNITIFWGDNTSTDIPAGTTLTMAHITHTYSSPGVYAIKIEDNAEDNFIIPVFNWSLYDNNYNKRKLIGHNTPLMSSGISDLSYFAKDCINLQYISPLFFKNYPTLRIVDYCFDGCVSLISIPKSIFYGCIYISSLQHFLSRCVSLVSVPNDIFENGVNFDADLSNFYDGDVHLTGRMDADAYFPNFRSSFVDVHEMFKNCINTTGDVQEFIDNLTKYTAYIDGTGTIDTGWGILTGRIYPQVIYNSDGQKVRDLIPANTGYYYNGKTAPQVCLYDSISDTFLLPVPDSSFTYHEEIDTTERENNIPDSYKKYAFYNCDKWDNYARVENIWTGILDGRSWLATSDLNDDWLIIDDKTLLLTEFDTNDLLATVDESILANTVDTLSALTGDHSSVTPVGVIKPEKYETADSLRNIIDMLPSLRGYTKVGNPTIKNGIMTNLGSPNYLYLPYLDLYAQNSFNFIGTFTTGATLNTTGTIFSLPFEGGDGVLRQYGSYLVDNILYFYCARSSNNQDISTPITLSPNTTYSLNWKKDNGVVSTAYKIGDTAWINLNNDSGANTTVNPSEPIYIGVGHLPGGSIDLNRTSISVNGKMWFDGTEQLNEVLDLSGCIHKDELTQADLQIAIDKGYTIKLV